MKTLADFHTCAFSLLSGPNMISIPVIIVGIFFHCVRYFNLGAHFVLRGQPLANNSVIALTDVGELGDALLCRTNLTSCCGTVPNRFGQFYYPNGVAVPINSQQQGFYRNRGNQEIRLHRRSGVNSPTGKYRCEIPDSNMNLQSVFIDLV